MHHLLFADSETPAMRLLFHPRFAAYPGVVQALLLGLLLLVPVGLMLWLYRYEMGLIRPAMARLLFALRMLVVTLLWALIGLQPVLGRTVSETVPGQVLVAVDRSDSMRISDPQRSPVEKLRLAQAFRLYEGTTDAATLKSWIEQYELARKDTIALDGPAREQHDALLAKVDALSRLEVAQKVLTPAGLDLLNGLKETHGLHVVGFSQEIGEIPAEQLDRLAEKSATGGDGEQFTDLRLPLSRAVEMAGPNQARVLGVVLLTDGRHDWGPSPVARAGDLAQRKIPIYPIAIGPRQAPPDVAIPHVEAPSAVFKDGEATIDVTVQVSNLSARKLEVELQFPETPAGRKPPLKESIDHDGQTGQYTVTFHPRMDQIGTQVLTVQVANQPEEKHTANNQRKVRINVADERAKVLVIDGEARWEYHYLASALERDRSMQSDSVVFQQPRLNRLTDADLKEMKYPATQMPSEPDALTRYDCVILGDTLVEQLPLTERIRLEKYVAESGGTLVLLAGKRAMPMGFLKASAAAPDGDPLSRLLPIEQPREVRPLDGFAVQLTPEGRAARFLMLDSTVERSLQRWSALPLYFWGLVGKAKPGASTLAFFDDGTTAKAADTPQARAAQTARERENALIVRQNYGFGRVLFIGLDSTWRWRYKKGDLYHHKFWSQVIRWAAADKPLVTGNDVVRFGTREPVYDRSEEVEIVARLGDAARPLPADALMGARIIRQKGDGKEESAGIVPLQRRAGQPRELDGKIQDLPPGQYAIELVIPDLGELNSDSLGPDGKPMRMRASFEVAPAESEEMIQLAANWPLLEELASRTDGKVYTPDQAREVIDQINRQTATRTYPIENRLWQSWYALAIFLLLLTVEWVLRKTQGLP